MASALLPPLSDPIIGLHNNTTAGGDAEYSQQSIKHFVGPISLNDKQHDYNLVNCHFIILYADFFV